QWREAMIGALTFSLLWVSAKLLFVTYGTYSTIYTHLYGSLFEVVLLLLWVYYSSALLLIGAGVAHHLQQRAFAVSAMAEQVHQRDPVLPYPLLVFLGFSRLSASGFFWQGGPFLAKMAGGTKGAILHG